MANEVVLSRPETITVSAIAHEDLEATHADLEVTIRGSSLWHGDSALNKAREVSALVAELGGIGIGAGSIELRGVKADVATGALGSRSAATYTVRVVKVPLDKVADAIGIVTSQKTATLNGVRWGYGEEQEIRLRLMEKALLLAKEKAELTARVLMVALQGVYSLAETVMDEEKPYSTYESLGQEQNFGRSRPRRATGEDLGMDISHSKRVAQRVEIAFKVSPSFAR